MAAEMAEQPACIAALAGKRARVIEELGPLFSDTVGTVVLARGSSDHAATTGRYLLEMATHRPVASASPSIHTLYRTEVDFDGYVVIAASQSGRTPEITTVLDLAARRGGRTIALTNDPASPLARTAQAVVPLGAGEELAVPATKTVTAEIVAFALLAEAAAEATAAVATSRSREDGATLIAPAAWDALPAQVASVLADPEPMHELARWLGGSSRLATVARGPLSGAAAETALKLQETSPLLASAFSAADLRHGPIALASSGISVLVLAHPGPAEADVLDLASDLSARGADVRLLGPVPGAVASWARTAPDLLAPVLAVVRGQQLALQLARLHGLDPDRPAGLTKVTTT